jgi:hypothetical protein
MPCDELITRPRSPTICEIIMKLKAEVNAQGACRDSEKKLNDSFPVFITLILCFVFL